MRLSTIFHALTSVLASFYDMPNTFGPDAAMETNDLGKYDNVSRLTTMTDDFCAFSCLRYILACMPPFIAFETRVVRSHQLFHDAGFELCVRQ